MNGFLEYAPGDSFLHRLNPVVKLLCALAFAIACFLSHNVLFLGAMLAVGLVLSVSAGMLRQTTGLVKAVFGFSLILALIQVLTVSQGARIVSLPWGYVGSEGIRAAFTTVLRLEAAAIPLFLVFYVTKISDLTNAFVKMLRIPYKYAFTFSSTVHFIPVFLNDMKGIMEAQTARGVEFDRKGIVGKVRLVVPLCVPLLVQSVRKTNSAAIAAEVRGFNLRTRASGFKEYPIAVADIAVVVAVAVMVVASAAL
ncbi:MAG: energy-coupling factor transporter transmembrane protein EcfT [Eggerthellaceae bacterium]|nr:energy-coupling factor transporter transmembrane protein EcfT [Eggerthellaceae bacterium]